MRNSEEEIFPFKFQRYVYSNNSLHISLVTKIYLQIKKKKNKRDIQSACKPRNALLWVLDTVDSRGTVQIQITHYLFPGNVDSLILGDRLCSINTYEPSTSPLRIRTLVHRLSMYARLLPFTLSSYWSESITYADKRACNACTLINSQKSQQSFPVHNQQRIHWNFNAFDWYPW